jgi:hypothetical protein
MRIGFGKFGLFQAFIPPITNIVETSVLSLIPIVFFFAFGLSHFLLVNYLVANIPKTYILLFTFIIIPVLPLSILTYYLLPITNNPECFYNSIKAGYPVFWTTIFMGLAGWIIEKKYKEPVI